MLFMKESVTVDGIILEGPEDKSWFAGKNIMILCNLLNTLKKTPRTHLHGKFLHVLQNNTTKELPNLNLL